MNQNQNAELDEDEIREAVSKAEPPAGTIEWAEHIINEVYESQISGPGANITKIYELPYIEAAAICSIEVGVFFQGLKSKLKLRGARIGDWTRRVCEREYQIKAERRAQRKVEVQQQAQARQKALAAQIAATAADGIPAGFKLTKDTLYLLREHKDEIEEIEVCSHLEVVALVRDANGNEWGRLLRFPDLDGREHEWAMPAEMLAGDGVEYRARLLEQGLRIWPSSPARDGLHKYISQCRPAARARGNPRRLARQCICAARCHVRRYSRRADAVPERSSTSTLVQPPRLARRLATESHGFVSRQFASGVCSINRVRGAAAGSDQR